MAADVLAGGAIKRGDVLSCFAAEGRLRSLGAIEVLEGERPVPFIDRAVRLAAPLASFLLDVEPDYGDDRLRTVAPLAHVSGRAPTLDRIASVLAQPGTLPVLVAAQAERHAIRLELGEEVYAQAIEAAMALLD